MPKPQFLSYLELADALRAAMSDRGCCAIALEMLAKGTIAEQLRRQLGMSASQALRATTCLAGNRPSELTMKSARNERGDTAERFDGVELSAILALLDAAEQQPLLDWPMVRALISDEEVRSLVDQNYRDTLASQIEDSCADPDLNQALKEIRIYLAHVKADVKGEKLRNIITGAETPPDQNLMCAWEEVTADSDRRTFRKSLIDRARDAAKSGGADFYSLYPELFFAHHRRRCASAMTAIDWSKVEAVLLAAEEEKAFEAQIGPDSSDGLDSLLILLRNLKGLYGHSYGSARNALLFFTSDRLNATKRDA